MLNEICNIELHDIVLPAPQTALKHPAFDEFNTIMATLGATPYIEANLLPEYLRDWAIVNADGSYFFHNPKSSESFHKSMLERQKIYTTIPGYTAELIPLDLDEYVLISSEHSEPRPPEQLAAQIPILNSKPAASSLGIAGGNLIAITMPDGVRQLVLVGEASFITAAVENKIAPANYPAFKHTRINLLRRIFKLQDHDEIIVIPQNSYHLDLDIAVLKPGVVIVNSYADIYHPAKIDLLAKQIIEKTKHIHPKQQPLLVGTRNQIALFKAEQANLDAIAKQLQDRGIMVIRALGNLGFAAKFGAIPMYVRDSLKLFSFINGISVQNKENFHFFTLATYREFSEYQDKFAAALASVDVTCHSLNSSFPIINHATLDRGAGLRCCSLIVPKQTATLATYSVAEATSTATVTTKAIKLNNCQQCGKPANQKCSRCKSVFYCSVTCQKAAWSNHKFQCHTMPN